MRTPTTWHGQLYLVCDLLMRNDFQDCGLRHRQVRQQADRLRQVDLVRHVHGWHDVQLWQLRQALRRLLERAEQEVSGLGLQWLLQRRL